MEGSDQSYKDQLDSMPVHKAPGEIWDRLETSLFALKTDLMPVHNAPAEVWASINRRYFLRRKIFYWSFTLLALLIMTVPVYLLLDKQPAAENYGMPASVPSTNTPEYPQRPDQEYIHMIPIQSSSVNQELIHALIAPGHSPGYEMTGSVPGQKVAGTIITMPTINADITSEQEHQVLPRDRSDDCSPFTSGSEFMFGLSYEYQHFLKGGNYLDTKLDSWHSISANGRLCFGNVYIESGLGISLSRDETNWAYTYLQNTLINTYEYVDSIHYDPNTGETIYYTSTVEVYDSIPYSKAGTVTRNISYLRIPLLVGINLFHKRNFSSSIGAGLTYNILLSNTETRIEYYEPESTITAVHYQETSRVDHSFNLALRLNLEWHHKRMMIYAYPSFHYYLNPVYDGQEGGNPISVGAGAGIFFK